MRLLVLDTALTCCTVGVMADGRVVASLSKEMQRGHAELLFPMLAEVMNQARVTYQDLDCVAVSAGPGSFTGIRIGIAAARGLALALRIPAVAVGVLEALAEEGGRIHHGVIVAANHGPRRTVYWQRFHVSPESGPRPLSEPAWEDADRFPCEAMSTNCLFVGSAAAPLAERCGATAMIRQYPDVAALGNVALRRETGISVRPAPIYVRPPDARPRE